MKKVNSKKYDFLKDDCMIFGKSKVHHIRALKTFGFHF